ncbi:phosphoenolpyruvate-protein phosphotransferase : Phosphoenolpyruvate-protein phosphotransferase OS=uncultured planctomycete GN=HGMM_F07G10C17 PE=3 SV=1: PEP-utilisers_N: PEP-utilizers: PEP-utilizers_C [Gemmataceae bacterium]|nr:phosphoenolpyruvate-protein phosphotransferase : Phosphoenolpyruvate-protein phosphotransferase OS=uncultured planctomycete GN=HGMM_F07G10C17 PE=3 SV=1: PEP-utilisers_N: PEP-utilizers: PEP-utilizers_C [Gemmataceae bacterium]VTU01103.1 phosphoenolpyruvate-protein phosphotransferase : Phosphoenolpyruvate-protein phosphotransferase OS=uncultured planctomycete GN=HGMM_F07G10C17 PE=3 SV=1: PEP-utilisers_N: PEP-utilizers: PEP-utilizers_C [Gemmataceae bacterium]
MEIRHHGIAVSPGVAIGPAFVIDTEGVRITHQTVAADQAPGEVARLRKAFEVAATEARENRLRITALHGPAIGNIFAAQGSVIEDSGFREQIEALVRSQLYSAEYAVSRVIREFVRRLEEFKGPEHHRAEVRRRAKDFIDIERQILALLQGDNLEPFSELTEPVVVLATDLLPSETADFSPRTVHAFATESGGATSHTAILAGALEIPAVVGIGRFLSDVSGGDVVIVDGEEGILIINPDESTLARYEEKRTAERSRADRCDSLRDKPSATGDGIPVRLLGNIELAQEAAHCLERGAEGVGLYRTEFLYLNKTTDPTEQEHFEAYRQVVQTLGPTRPVVIRTLDLGADKFTSATGGAGEKNPFLGLRSVRLCLRKLDLFKTQLRALLRVATLGNVRVMFPMISTVEELRQCKTLLNEVKEDLEDAGIPFKRDLSVGTMIEVPSAALMADVLAREVDFFSIGTNDLIQYTLAADRNNESVAHLYNATDPAVLRLIKRVVDAAEKEQIEVNVCGEMSGEPLYAPLLVGLGLRQLSVTPRKVPEIKRVIRQLRVDEARRLADQCLNMETARQVGSFLRDQLRRILPEAAD